MAWNAILLLAAVLVLLLTVGSQYGSESANRAPGLAHTLAPQLGVPEDRLREVLADGLPRVDPARRKMFDGAPVAFLAALMAVRLILQWRAAWGNPWWNAAVLLVAVAVLAEAATGEHARAVNEASEPPQTMAPQLGVPEERLREVLWEELLRNADSRMMARGAPMGFLTALVAVRLILDWRAARRKRGKPAG